MEGINNLTNKTQPPVKIDFAKLSAIEICDKYTEINDKVNENYEFGMKAESSFSASTYANKIAILINELKEIIDKAKMDKEIKSKFESLLDKASGYRQTILGHSMSLASIEDREERDEKGWAY